MREQVFDTPKGDWRKGAAKVRTWKAPYTHGLTDLWRKRCIEYWARVEARFGVIMSEPRNVWGMDPDIGPVVCTYAVVVAVVPGKRVEMPREEQGRVH